MLQALRPSHDRISPHETPFSNSRTLPSIAQSPWLIADACAKAFDGTGALTTATLDAPELADRAISEQRWPIEVKLHGDFRSNLLKNTTAELQTQDAQLRALLIRCCRRFGLVVSGYSGRDDSVMDALDEAAATGAFPSGLFWLHRDASPPPQRVLQLLQKANSSGTEAALVLIDNFDETFRDLLRMFENIDTHSLAAFSAGRSWWSAAPAPTGGRDWPVVRLNAMPIQIPTVCRRVVCNIGGSSEVRQAVEDSEANIFAARVRAGVLAFGADSEVRRAFGSNAISTFDLYTIEERRLQYDSGERGLLRVALTRALERNRGLATTRRRNADLLSPVDINVPQWNNLRRLVGPINGIVPNCDALTWREGVAIRLDWAHGRLWMLIEPRIVFEGINKDTAVAAIEFARERTVRRYNSQLNSLIDFWAHYLAGQEGGIRALGIADGVDATFGLRAPTAFSWRLGV